MKTIFRMRIFTPIFEQCKHKVDTTYVVYVIYIIKAFRNYSQA